MADVDIVIKAKDDASRQLEGIQNRMQSMSKSFKIAGGIMMGVGAGITASLGMAMKAAAEEQAGITRMAVAMRNMGIDYEKVKGSLEAWIDAQQQKTSVADDAQRESLSQLITMTGDLAKAQDLLTIGMDIAAGTGKDLASVTSTLGYALAGNWGMVNRMIPGIADLATEEERWLALRERFVGQAEAYGQTMAGQFELLQNNIGDIKESIGGLIAEALTPLVGRVQAIVQNIKPWVEQHRELLSVIVPLTGVVGGVLMPLGLMVALLPSLARGLEVAARAVVGLKLATIEYTAIALASLALMYGVFNFVRSLKGEAYMAPTIGETIFGQIKQDVTALYGKLKELMPDMQSDIQATTETTKGLSQEWGDYAGTIEDAKRRIAEFGDEGKKSVEKVSSAIEKTTYNMLENQKVLAGWAMDWGTKLTGITKVMVESGFTQWYSWAEAGFPGLPKGMWAMPTPEGGVIGGMPQFPPQAYIPGYEGGGVIERTGLIYAHRGEVMLPQGTKILAPVQITLNGRVLADELIEIIGDRAALQGG